MSGFTPPRVGGPRCAFACTQICGCGLSGRWAVRAPSEDLRAGVPTLPVILLRKKNDADSIELLELIDSGLESDEDLHKAVAALSDHEVMEESISAAVSWAEKAKLSLAPLPDGSVKKALEAFADAVVERKG